MTSSQCAFARGFSLIEVVIAIGLVAFCLMALLGLFSVGLGQSRDSSQTVQAAHLMTRIISERTARAVIADPDLALPRLDQAADTLGSATPVYLNSDGLRIASAQDAAFQLNYRVVVPSVSDANTALRKISRSWVSLSWPAGSTVTDLTSAYEMTFLHTLP